MGNILEPCKRKVIRFVLRTNERERKSIERLAELLHRTESDAIRFVVREKLQQIEGGNLEQEAISHGEH